MKNTTGLLPALLILLVCNTCSASVPAMMNYQGKLTNNLGQPVADGSHSLTFKLYNVETGGTTLWTETRSVQVTGGVFSVLLGSSSALPDSAFQGTTWLETSVGGTALSPRTRIVSVGYSLRSKTAETVPSSAITSSMLGTGSVTSAKIQDGTISYADLSSTAVSSIAKATRTGDSVFNVKDYGALGNSTTDDTAAFQAALNAAAAGNGGGVVFVPSGTYKIAGHLEMPAATSIEGVSRTPQRWYGSPRGSTLLAVEGAGNANGAPFIQMHTECAIKGIAIYYPNQSKTAPVAYPWCIRGEGDNNAIIDVLLVNPWQAVDLGTYPCGRHLVRNLYAQALYRGIFVDKCFDVGRIEDVHFWPFWDSSATMLSYMKTNGSIAFYFMRTDWEMASGCFCICYQTGYLFAYGNDGPGNVMLTNSGADESPTTVRVEGCQDHCGIVWTNCQFQGTAEFMPTNTGPVKFNNCSFYGYPGINSLARNTGAGLVAFSGCQFQNWDWNNDDSPALYLSGTRNSITNCYFMSSGEKQMEITPNVWTAVVTGNTFAGGKRIVNNCPNQVIEAHNTTQ